MVSVVNTEKRPEDLILGGRLERAEHIPYDKSWIIRNEFLDVMNNRLGGTVMLAKLAKEKRLGDDLLAMYKASIEWLSGSSEIYVGESATVYRLYRFAAWKHGEKKTFIKERTLKNRDICDDPEIVNWTQEQLLELKTSQEASAAALLGDSHRVANPPFKLAVTYDAIDHYEEQRKLGKAWKLRYDDTIKWQAAALIKFMRTGRMEFEPQQAEDYPFARAFGLITVEEGVKRWPQMEKHETNRFIEVESALQKISEKKLIDTLDHRVMQAAVAKCVAEGHTIEFVSDGKPGMRVTTGNPLRDIIRVEHPETVNKSWQEFWPFIRCAYEIARSED